MLEFWCSTKAQLESLRGGEGRVFGSRVPYKRGDKRPVFEFPGSRTCWSISGHLEDFLFYF